YRQIYEHVKPQAPVPDLVIYLQASVNTLISRVKKRGNPVEHGIDEGYLRGLSEAYTRYFYDYSDGPLLIVNSEKLNFAEIPEHLDLLIERINAMRGGREFFNRA
ncbi:MAG TPA: deoxynucleoside kinase, partial [Usitatibacter sp.]